MSAETPGREDSAAALSRAIAEALGEIRSAEQFMGSPVKGSAELRALCVALSAQLENCVCGRETDVRVVRECVIGVRARAVAAKVDYVKRNAKKIRGKIGENLLHARFSEYENLFLQLSIGAKLSEKAEHSPEARHELLEWARREWDNLESAHAKLKIAEKPLTEEKRKNLRDRLRPWAVGIATMAGGAIAALLAQFLLG